MNPGILAKPMPLAPAWLAHRFDEATGGFHFVDYSRSERGAALSTGEGAAAAAE